MELTDRELLLLSRRRKGWNQVKMAKQLGVSSYIYKGMERGTIPMMVYTPDDLEPPISRCEICLIKRLRSGLTQAQVAAEMKRSKFWVRQMEQGKVEVQELENFWNGR